MQETFDIRSLRQSKRFGQQEFADLFGIDLPNLKKMERGLLGVDRPLRQKILSHFRLSGNEERLEDISYARRISGEGYVTSVPKKVEMRGRKTDLNDDKLSIIDLFCGVGGFSAGFEQSGAFEVVAGVDLLGDRLDTFASNHPAANAYGLDIRKLSSSKLGDENPRPYAIVGGPPCQGFSSIRPFRNVDWDDPRNNLAEEFCRIVNDLRPSWVVFENVVGLVRHEGGRVFKSILSAFQEIGYRTDARVLNSAFYGLPQRRERLIIVGSLEGKKFRWPEPTHNLASRSMVGKNELLVTPKKGLFGVDLRSAITVREAIDDLPPLESGESVDSYARGSAPSDYAKLMRNGATQLTLHNATKHSAKMLEIIRHAGSSIHALPSGMVSSGFSSCYSRLAADEPSVTITVNFVHPASNRCIHPDQNRALTPREGARIQGFYDSFNFEGSRAQIVKQIGNAVPPILGRKIAEAILESS